MNRKNHLVSLAVASALASSICGVALADQQSGPAATTATTTAAAAPSDQLATIVVTATKRKTLEQDTPISMTVLTAANIADRGVTDFNTLVARASRISRCAPPAPIRPSTRCAA